ncbi:MAG TPA: hypothetical protein PK299_08705 [Anaerolineales bacterium]|nr:hypothetical protein [Anaerolineales bacterium]
MNKIIIASFIITLLTACQPSSVIDTPDEFLAQYGGTGRFGLPLGQKVIDPVTILYAYQTVAVMEYTRNGNHTYNLAPLPQAAFEPGIELCNLQCEVDPLFGSFYQTGGGYAVFGLPISLAKFVGTTKVQYFEHAKFAYVFQPEGKSYTQLEPLGQQIFDSLTNPISNAAPSTLIPEAIGNYIEKFGGEAVVGSFLEKKVVEYGKDVFYVFENLVVEVPAKEPDSVCVSQSNRILKKGASISTVSLTNEMPLDSMTFLPTGFVVLSPFSQFYQTHFGHELLGKPLGNQYEQDGKVVQDFDNGSLQLVHESGAQQVRLAPLPGQNSYADCYFFMVEYSEARYHTLMSEVEYLGLDPDTQQHKIEFIVTDENGYPIKNVTLLVEVEDSRGKRLVYSEPTNQEGLVSITLANITPHPQNGIVLNWSSLVNQKTIGQYSRSIFP